MYKCFMCILTARLEQWVESRGELGEMQQGFRKGRQLMDNVYMLTQLVEIARLEKRELMAVFMDIKGAYDRVRWLDLWERLRDVRVGERFVGLLQRVYEGGKYTFQ